MKKPKIPKPRGVDFLINWSMGSWSEDRVLEAINDTGKYVAVRYGVSRVGPFSFEEYARYYQRLQRMYLHGKRPDLLVFDSDTYQKLKQRWGSIVDNLMDVPNSEADKVVKEALFGVEVEVSKWHVGKMLEYQGKKRRKTSILGPTFTIKEEDFEPLIKWVTYFNKEIVIVQTFYDRAYATTFSAVRNLIERKRIGESIEGVEAKVDRKTKKMTYYIPCLKYGVLFGEFNPLPDVRGRVLIDEMGQLWPMAEFVNGKLRITDEGLKLLDKASRGH